MEGISSLIGLVDSQRGLPLGQHRRAVRHGYS
jgi:hypothetical protein